MKDGSFFINTARGTIVDYEALAEITPQKKKEVVIGITDPNEPLPSESPLRKLDNVFITPHIAGSRGAAVNGYACSRGNKAIFG